MDCLLVNYKCSLIFGNDPLVGAVSVEGRMNSRHISSTEQPSRRIDP